MRLILSICLLIYAAYGWGEVGNNHHAGRTDTDASVEVNIVSSEWPPYVYLAEGGRPAGYAYDITLQVMAKSGLQYDFQVLPWSRVYRLGQSFPNVLISGIGRTPLREALFHWIAPLTKPNRVHFYRLKSRSISIDQLGQLKDYALAAERDTYYHQFLQQNGLDKGALVVSYRNKLLKLLLSKRVDFVLMDEVGFRQLVENDGLDPALFAPEYQAMVVAEYLAFSKGSSPEVMERVRRAYGALEQKGELTLH